MISCVDVLRGRIYARDVNAAYKTYLLLARLLVLNLLLRSIRRHPRWGLQLRSLSILYVKEPNVSIQNVWMTMLSFEVDKEAVVAIDDTYHLFPSN